jgi:glycosidase
MKNPVYPSLYQINTRVWLTELSAGPGSRATLDDIPDIELDRLEAMGFDWIWFLSVWSTGELGRKVSLENPDFRLEFEKTLPDLLEEDIGGSGFAISDYRVPPELGGDDALKRLHKRLRKRGLKLMLDFVPNHMGPDHAWIHDHADFFVQGTIHDLENYPWNYTRLRSGESEIIFAYGRDPYFTGWPDTVQLDYSNPAKIDAMIKELLRVASLCDGVRCDMAMLVLPEIFEKTWGRRAEPFWSVATSAVRKKYPDFLFMAEVYWDLEWNLQQQGFNYAYDKRLYDRLHEGNPIPVREHFYAGSEYQDKLARFLENHDEPRAASAFELKNHEAAAIVTYLSPGLRFFHQGQFEGRKKRISPHLIRGPRELPDEDLQKFYFRLLNTIKQSIFRDGQWQLCTGMPAWEGNNTWNSFLAFTWQKEGTNPVLIAVNYAPYNGQCFISLPFLDLREKYFQFKDLMSDSVYDRDRDDLLSRGLFLDLPAWGYHVFEIRPLSTTL